MDKYSYRYEENDPYCYPGTNVLINKLNIRDAKRLHEAEQEITNINLFRLQVEPIRGRFGFAHLCAIHRFIFQDIYEWAGVPRSGGFLSKGGTLFVQGVYIVDSAKRLFTQLQDEQKLRGLDKERFIQRMAYYMGEVNALHPFREGNGRTAREFFRTLALKAGYSMDYGLTDRDTMLNADIAAYGKDYESLVALLKSIVSETHKH